MHHLQLDISKAKLLREHETRREQTYGRCWSQSISYLRNRWVSTARPRKNQKLSVLVGYLIHCIYTDPILHKIKGRHVVSCICSDARRCLHD